MSEEFGRDALDEELDDASVADKYLTFILGNDEYGINIGFVTEIIGIVPITFVPDLPPFVKGIVNLRGQMIPVIDVRMRFMKEPLAYNDRTCIIVIQIRDVPVGFIVDSVAACEEIPPDSVIPPPPSKGYGQQKYVKGIGRMNEKIVLLLDCEKLINEDMGIAVDGAA